MSLELISSMQPSRKDFRLNVSDEVKPSVVLRELIRRARVLRAHFAKQQSETARQQTPLAEESLRAER
jgi:hypothetical protein